MQKTDIPLIRTPNQGCYQVVEDSWWGMYLSKVPDPDANVKCKPANSFGLIESFPKIPSSIFSRIVNLFKHYAHQNLEVTVRFYRNEAGTEWKCVVPVQKVSMASVQFDYSQGLIDIETGVNYPPSFAGWHYAGSFHSHHQMRCEWSGTDDADELGNPGLHGLIHSMNLKTGAFTPIASIVLQKERHVVPATSVIDTTYNPALQPHPEVFKVILQPKVDKLKTSFTSSLGHQRNDWAQLKYEDVDYSDYDLFGSYEDEQSEIDLDFLEEYDHCRSQGWTREEAYGWVKEQKIFAIEAAESIKQKFSIGAKN